MASKNKANQKIELQRLRRENRQLKGQASPGSRQQQQLPVPTQLPETPVPTQLPEPPVPTQLPETEGSATATTKKKGKGKEVWRDYDAASQGGAKFDNKDLKHLVDEGWSYNDIMKAAVAATGGVKAGADRQLRLLGTKESKYSPFKQDGFKAPRDVFWSSFDLFGEGASDPDNRMNRVRFLGGDPDKAKNWIVAATDRDKGSAQSPDYYGSLGNDAGMSWHRPGTKWIDKKGKSQEVLTWGGLDGEGRGLALKGIEIKGDDSKFNRQNRTTTWALPKDLVDQQFADRVNAVTPTDKPTDETGGDATTPEQPATLPAYDYTPTGADYGTYTYEMDNDTPLFNTFTKRFAAADAFKARIGLG